MMLLRRIAHRLRHLFRRQQSEAEMTEEIRFHLEQRAADYAADGLPGEEAGFAAQRKFGNVIISRTMAQRSSEFAIRLALGASIGNLTRMVLASGVKLALVGSALGLVGALGVSRVFAFGFPGMRLNSPIILVGTTLLLIAIALVACWLPARRAGQVDAMAVLRAE